MSRSKFSLLLLAGFALAIAPATTAVAMPWALSEDFAWKYEFDLGDPTPDNADIDLNGTDDFRPSTSAGATSTVMDGYLNMVSLQAGSHYYVSGNSNSTYLDESWPQAGPTLASGHTVEFRARVNSQVGLVSAFTMNTSSLGAGFGWLMVGIDSLKWGPSSPPTLLSGVDNTDWHTYRMVQREGINIYDIWRDGVAVTGPSGIGPGYGSTGYTRLLFGDFVTSAGGGNYDFDYVRFTAGAYAPAPEPTSCALLLFGGLGLAVMSTRRRRKT